MAMWTHPQLMHHPLVWLPFVLWPMQAATAGVLYDIQPRSPAKCKASTIISQPLRHKVTGIARARYNDGDEDEREHSFLATVLPLVLMENERVERNRQAMLRLVEHLDHGGTLSVEDARWLIDLAREYRVVGDPTADHRARAEMRQRVDIIPVELALAQAAVETGWGRSHSVRKDRDLFGLTGFTPSRAKTRRSKVARAPKFATLRESVRVYVHTLNSHPAYRRLRQIRLKLREQRKPLRGISIAEGLGKYSTRGKAYIKTVQDTILRHDLEGYTLTRLPPLASAYQPRI